MAEMPALNSSCLTSVEYDFDSGTMSLGFRSGRTYTLHGVPEYHYHGLLNASSPGRYFNVYLKGRY
jgi:hypothetical protein